MGGVRNLSKDLAVLCTRKRDRHWQDCKSNHSNEVKKSLIPSRHASCFHLTENNFRQSVYSHNFNKLNMFSFDWEQLKTVTVQPQLQPTHVFTWLRTTEDSLCTATTSSYTCFHLTENNLWQSVYSHNFKLHMFSLDWEQLMTVCVQPQLQAT